jgi:hypothetical protein
MCCNCGNHVHHLQLVSVKETECFLWGMNCLVGGDLDLNIGLQFRSQCASSRCCNWPTWASFFTVFLKCSVGTENARCAACFACGPPSIDLKTAAQRHLSQCYQNTSQFSSPITEFKNTAQMLNSCPLLHIPSSALPVTLRFFTSQRITFPPACLYQKD